MANKTIYIKDDKLWGLAKKLAGKEGLSAVIQDALAKFVEQKRRETEGFERHRFDTRYREDAEGCWGPSDAIAFEGREVASKILGVTVQQGEYAGEQYDAHFTVYRTRAGKLLLTQNPAEYPEQVDHYAVYDSLRALARDPELAAADEVARAAFLNEITQELGEDWAVWIE